MVRNLFLLFFLFDIAYSCTVHIIVPCYNEAKRFDGDAFINFVNKGKFDLDGKGDENRCPIKFTFVNDGSTDDTLNLLEMAAYGAPDRLSVLDLQTNVGKAEATRQGMLSVLNDLGSSDIVGFWDGDLATPLSEISRFLDIFESRPSIEMVFGSRVALLGRNIHRHASRHYLGRVFATMASVLLQLRVYDTQCGAKLFRATPDFKSVLSEPFENRWIFDVELIARFIAIRRPNLALPQVKDIVYEMPLNTWHDISGSKITFSHKVRALHGLFHIWNLYFSPWASKWPWPIDHQFKQEL
eukprot:g4442.t1